MTMPRKTELALTPLNEKYWVKPKWSPPYPPLANTTIPTITISAAPMISITNSTAVEMAIFRETR